MNMRARIGLLVQAQGASRAASDIGGVARQVDRVGDKADQTGRRMKRARTEANLFRGGIRSLSSTMKVGAVAATALTLALGKGAVDEYREAFKAGRATSNAIQASGHAANVSRKHIEDRANALSLSAGIDDEAIQSAQNLLLTFKKVRNEVGAGNDVFDQATKTALDMSAAYDQSLKTSSIQLGKALQDPVKGAAALKRVGAIDQGDIDTIKDMAKAHRSLGDQQKYVLDAINSAGVKGRASAIADPFDKAKVAWDNFKETLGFGIAPVLKQVLRPFTPFARDLSRIFARKDIDFGEKMRLGFESAKRHFGPFLSDLWSDLRSANLPEKLLDQIDKAIPVIIDHIAAAAPKAASMFVHAFTEMGPWGQLLTVAYLAKKLGAFPALGRLAAGKFVTAFTPVAATGMSNGLTLVGGPTGTKFGSKAGKAAMTAMKGLPWVGLGLIIADMLGLDEALEDAVAGIADFVSNPTGTRGALEAGVVAGATTERVPGPRGWIYRPASQPGSKGGGGINNPDNAPDGHSRRAGRDIHIHTTVETEGRETGRAVYRVALRDLLNASTD